MAREIEINRGGHVIRGKAGQLFKTRSDNVLGLKYYRKLA